MHILIVEDEVKLAKAMKKALELQNYAVDLAFDGESGWEIASTEKVDAIILDVMLPKIDGFTLCRRLRKLGLKTPILLLTAKGQIGDKVQGLDAGADDYMVKPFSFEELFARLRALVRRANQTVEPVLRVADLTLDPKTFQVQRAGRSIILSGKEFAILEYLMRHKNTVLTREQILRHVWNYEADVLPTTVEVHIKHLRDKIDLPSSPALIITARGFGYVMKEKES